MYGAYKRTTSYFENSDMAAKGLPDAAELALLEPFRDKIARAMSSARPSRRRSPTARARIARCCSKRQ